MGKTKTLAEFEALTKDAKVLEQESAGIKVLQLPDNRIVKLFRRKRVISSQIWAPHAWRFSRNAKTLKQRGIKTITVESYFEIPEMERQAVVYYRLEGNTLRDWLRNREESERDQMIAKLGAFIAQLHEAGVLFRSLHLGNILVMEDQELALIDIVDMGFRWFGPLNISQRIRNFHHMDRYDEDRLAIVAKIEDGFIDHYLKSCSLPEGKKANLRQAFKDIFDKYLT